MTTDNSLGAESSLVLQDDLFTLHRLHPPAATSGRRFWALVGGGPSTHDERRVPNGGGAQRPGKGAR